MSEHEKTPSLLEKGWNLTSTVVRFVGSGFAQTAQEEYHTRLTICDTCDQRRNHQCLACGCYLPAKAAMRVADCPKDKWPKLNEPEIRRPYVINDLGEIHGELQNVPEGWTQVTVGHWAPPWRPCRHRRVSKKYSDPPVITPFCAVINEHVTTEICNVCEIREP